ncbi:MAG TPA: SigB/SigF/SigG family RNA polymerase sigma factor [Solirubrobacteraceae bacterium]|nr:SigB/SigF/SigG family RNA polymerase sigma factor [Solirubrobacteraceae bacterium]
MTTSLPGPDKSRSSLERVDDQALFRQWHSDRDRGAREELVQRHLALARKLAGRYARANEPFDDLFQVASLGLVKAIDRFDPDRGIAFSSFAVPTIVGELKRHFRDKGWSLHVPRGTLELALRVQDATTMLGSKTGRSPTVDEIADHLGVGTEQVLEALEALAARHATSLDVPVDADAGDESATRHETIGVEDDGYAAIVASASLADAVRRLPMLDRRVFMLRFRDELTQSEIAEQVGVSQMQVSRILRRVTAELRGLMDPEGAPGSPGERARARRG